MFLLSTNCKIRQKKIGDSSGANRVVLGHIQKEKAATNSDSVKNDVICHLQELVFATRN